MGPKVNSSNRTARFAGLLYLMLAIIAPYGLMYVPSRIIVRGDAATILVAAPEKKEHFGIIYTEAMAGNVPTVAYEGGGVNSIITDETGILTDRNPKALGEAVRSLLLDDEMRLTMALNCGERAKKYYATGVLGPRLNDWLLRVLGAN